MIDWIWGLAGGLMIGLAGAAYLLLNGRVMGASGIMGELVDGSAKGDDARERSAFLAGLVIVPGVIGLATGAATHLTASLAPVILAGLLVGFGTRIGGGCTSGHGVCGISRLSLRGIVATLIYMGSGAATVVLARTVGLIP